MAVTLYRRIGKGKARRYQKVNLGRGRRPVDLAGPYFLRYSLADGARPWDPLATTSTRQSTLRSTSRHILKLSMQTSPSFKTQTNQVGQKSLGFSFFRGKTKAIGCARTGDLVGAKSNADKLAELRDRLPHGNQGFMGNADLVEVQHLEAQAWLAHAEKREADAVKLMKSAISLEETTPASLFPAPLLAGNEQLGDLLLEQNQPEQALAAYEASLQFAPNRFNSLSGAGRAAELAGARSKAETYYGQLLTMCKNAESERPDLHSAKSFLEKQARLGP